MASEIGTPLTFSFADGNGGHACSLGTAPNVGETDILFVNSNTVVSTPSGFTSREDEVSNQGSYIFTRKASGGESSSVTITTSGDHNTQVTHRRWSGLNAFDKNAGSRIDASSGEGTNVATTATLAESGEVAFVFAALHSVGGTANQNNPVWTAGYGNTTGAAQGTGPTGVVGMTAYKTGAGTAAEAPQCVSWDGDGAFNRYTLVVTFTTDPAGLDGSGTAALPAVTATGSGTLRLSGTGAPTLGSPTAAGTGALSLSGTGTGTLGSLTASGAGTQPLSGSGMAALPSITAAGAGTNAAGALTSTRARLAECLSTVTGLTGFAEQPRVLKPGVGWPLLANVTFSGRYPMAEVEWRVIVVLGQTMTQALSTLEVLMDEAQAAFKSVMAVDEITPVAIPVQGNDLYGAEIRGRKEK